MADFYFDSTGDIRLSPNGDIALTDTEWRDAAQQAFVHTMTQPGDFLIYPSLGTDLDALMGLPQSKATAEVGKRIIINSLKRQPYFRARTIRVKAFPTGPQSIRFDIYITVGTRDDLILQVERNLGVTES